MHVEMDPILQQGVGWKISLWPYRVLWFSESGITEFLYQKQQKPSGKSCLATELFIIFLNAVEEPQAMTQELNKALLLLISINGGDSFSCPRIEVFSLQAFEIEKSVE